MLRKRLKIPHAFCCFIEIPDKKLPQDLARLVEKSKLTCGKVKVDNCCDRIGKRISVMFDQP